MTQGRLLPLMPFAAVAGAPAPTLRAGAERVGNIVRLRYVLGGSLADVQMPPRASNPLRADRLWEHTCFEAFLAPAGGDAYWEVNLSPAGHWNTYRFDRYREGMRVETRADAPRIAVERARCGTLTLRVTIALAPFAELASAPLDANLAAVLEARDGTLSHWALEHGAAAHPDFHRRETFVLRLDSDPAA